MELEPVLPLGGVLRGAACVPVFLRHRGRRPTVNGVRAVRLGDEEWVALLDVPAGDAPLSVCVDGTHAGELPRGRLMLPQAPVVEAPVVICMATYEPDATLFAAQLQSLRAQSRGDWRCVISDDCSSADVGAMVGDDERFVLVRGQRLGFYANFERALSHVGPATQFVALADQDDRWHPDKLAILTEQLEAGSADLAFADARVVDPTHRVLGLPDAAAPNDLSQFLLGNVVSGAAAVLRRSVLARALPFPVPFGRAYHDHWLGLVALAGGGIDHVAQRLWDYVQHGGNAVGHASLDRPGPPEPRLRRLRTVYRTDVLRIATLARTLALRTGHRSYLTRVDRDPIAQVRAALAAPVGRDLLAAAVLRRLLVLTTAGPR